MFLPELYEINVQRDMIRKFAGLNATLYVKDGEFSDMKNLSSDNYPVLSPRKKRHKIRQLTKPNGLFAHNKLAWVDGTGFYYNGILKGSVTDSKKQMVAMGAYIIIFPDKKYYNTHTDEYGDLGHKVELSSGSVSWELCSKDAVSYTYTSGTTAPGNPANGAYWLDTSGTPHVLKQYSSTQGTWASVPTTYVKISAAGIGEGFAEFDTVTISGITESALNGDFSLQKVESGYVLITAIIDAAGSMTASSTAKVMLERKVPDMDFITECDNRIWGCSNEKHEIYASKQGDPKNWYSYLGIASDSYAMTVGTRGDFTGAVTHLGYITFLKEDVIQKIYGSKPANFKLIDTNARGVEKGSEKSLTMINETLFYVSKSDICCYATSIPQGISRNLGNEDYKNAVGGALGRKYYVSMQDEDGNWGLYVYDTDYGTWHKEDDTHVKFFAAKGNELYFVDANGWMWNMNGTTTYDASGQSAEEGEIEWYAETGVLGMDEPDKKYISKLQFRVQADAGSTLRIEAAYDDGDFTDIFRYSAQKLKSFTVPVTVRRCDTVKLRLSGSGMCKVYSIAKTVEQGGDA